MKFIKIVLVTMTLIVAVNLVVKAAEKSSTTIIEKTQIETVQKIVEKRPSDEEMRVEFDNLLDNSVDFNNQISFRINQGIITLKGDLDNDIKKIQAEILARKINGVVAVDNKINIVVN